MVCAGMWSRILRAAYQKQSGVRLRAVQRYGRLAVYPGPVFLNERSINPPVLGVVSWKRFRALGQVSTLGPFSPTIGLERHVSSYF